MSLRIATLSLLSVFSFLAYGSDHVIDRVPGSAVCVPGNYAFPEPTTPITADQKWVRHGIWQISDTDIPPDVETFLASGFSFMYRFEHLNPNPADQIDIWMQMPERGVADFNIVFPNFFTTKMRGDIRSDLRRHKYQVKVDHNPEEVLEMIGTDYHSAPVFAKIDGVLTYIGLEKLVWDYDKKVYVHAAAAAKFDGKQATYRKLQNGKLEFAGYNEFTLPAEGADAEYAKHIPKVPDGVKGEDIVPEISLNYESSWMRAKQIAFYKKLIRAGVGHSIGVYAPGPDGTLVLAAGSFVVAHRGVFWSVAAVTKNEVDQKFPEIVLKGIDYENMPKQVRTRLTHAYSGAGNIETAASFLYGQSRGYYYIDNFYTFRGYGWEPFGARNISMTDYWDGRVLPEESRGLTFRDAGTTGPIDITALIANYVALPPTSNPSALTSQADRRDAWETYIAGRQATQAERRKSNARRWLWDKVKGEIRQKVESVEAGNVDDVNTFRAFVRLAVRERIRELVERGQDEDQAAAATECLTAARAAADRYKAGER